MKLRFNLYVTVAALLLTSNLAFCQSTTVELTKYYRKTVPKGKVWFVSNSKAHTLALTEGSFTSGTACNASMHSNPSYVYGIVCIDTITQKSAIPKMLGFTFKKPPFWLHDDVYQIRPYFLIKDDLNENLLSYSLYWIYQNDEIVFYPGMVLQTTACIKNLIIYERGMTAKDRKNLELLKAKK